MKPFTASTMISKSYRLSLLSTLCIFLVLLMIPQFSSGQFVVTMTSTPINKPCYSGNFGVNYVATVTRTGYTYPTNYTFNLSTTKFELTKASNPGVILATNFGGSTSSSPTISGSFDISAISGISLPNKPDVYTIFATIVINNLITLKSEVATTSITFTVGYESFWGEFTDMTAAPNARSVRRNQTTANLTYASATTSNYLPSSSNGWIDLVAQFNASDASNRSVFIPLSDFLPSTFNPSNSGNYVEYRKGGTITTTSGEGIYVKNGATIYKLQSVVLTDRIRIERTGTNSIAFYKTNTTTSLKARRVSDGTLFNSFSVTLSNQLPIMAYATNLSDGLSDVLCSMPCTESSLIYAHLSRSLDGQNYDAYGTLNFTYDEEYAPANSTLNYRILNWQHKTVQSSAVIAGSSQITANRIYGDNRYQLSLASSLTVGTTYILEVTNDKKEVFYLRFTRR